MSNEKENYELKTPDEVAKEWVEREKKKSDIRIEENNNRGNLSDEEVEEKIRRRIERELS